jgi:hypothetical protein
MSGARLAQPAPDIPRLDLEACCGGGGPDLTGVDEVGGDLNACSEEN